MELHLTPEQERQLRTIAQWTGRDAGQVISDALRRSLDEEERFVAGVRRGIEQADRGELLDHDEVVARLEKRFGS